jgi:pimeloyl-ACP methyl ester carboxylesterase
MLNASWNSGLCAMLSSPLRKSLRFFRFLPWMFLVGMPAYGADATSQEKQCIAKGWQRAVAQVNGVERELLWKAPVGPWTKGAIIVLHGGGGQHFQWCVANARIVEPQVQFSEMAIAEGFAVFLLNSSDRVTDREGRSCGKIWDDEVRDRPNLDLPFIGTVIRERMPQLRPPDSNGHVFITGLSSGGYMAARAGTHFDNLVTAFAPVSSGDPYGWHRVCEAGATLRTKVHGISLDNETGKRITEPGSCQAESYPNERPWDSTGPSVKPAFKVFRHHEDGINDQSCSEKISGLLQRNGYRGQPDFVLRGGRRGLANHLWLEAYNRPILDFFANQNDARAK